MTEIYRGKHLHGFPDDNKIDGDWQSRALAAEAERDALKAEVERLKRDVLHTSAIAKDIVNLALVVSNWKARQ